MTTPTTVDPHAGARRWPAWTPGLLAVLLSVVPVAGVFTLSQIFFVRDLAIDVPVPVPLSPPQRLLRVVAAAGIRTRATASRRSTTRSTSCSICRRWSSGCCCPRSIAYNVWVALPVPLSALGMYLFLRRHVSPPASAFGAVAFAVVGADRLDDELPEHVVVGRRGAVRVLGAGAGLRAPRRAGQRAARGDGLVPGAGRRAGDAGRHAGDRRRLRRACSTGAGATGAASRSPRSDWAPACCSRPIQYVPMVAAGRASMRSTMDVERLLAVPSAGALRAGGAAFLRRLLPVQPGGTGLDGRAQQRPRSVLLHDVRRRAGRCCWRPSPCCRGRPRTRFWTVVILACAVASLGPHTPLYPALQALVPPLRTFRFPVKYLSLAAFGLATLAAMALQWLLDGEVPRRAVRVVADRRGARPRSSPTCAIAWVLLAPDAADPRLLPAGGVGARAGADPGGRVPAASAPGRS